jgi:FkbM family methyltransferase
MNPTMLTGLDARALHFTNEAFTRLIYSKIVRSGDTVLDVGANAGLHTVELARIVTAAGLVHAFEPNVKHFPRLLSIAGQVVLWPMALGRTLSVETLHVPEGLDGWSSLESLDGAVGNRRVEKVPVVQVPLESLSLPIRGRLSFVKVDVENRELDVLVGAEGLLREHRPVIIAENVTPEILRVMVRLGYEGVDYFGTSLKDRTETVCGPDKLPNGMLLPDEIKTGFPFLVARSTETRGVLGRARALDGVDAARAHSRSPFRNVAASLGRLIGLGSRIA